MNLIFNHHLFFTSGRISESVRYNNHPHTNHRIKDSFDQINLLNGSNNIVQIIHHKAAIRT